MKSFNTIAWIGIILFLLICGCTYNNVDELKLKNWKYLNTTNSKLSSDNIYDMKIDSKGNVWVLCGGTLINYINKINADLSIDVYEIPFSDSISTNFRSAKSIAIDKYDRLWVGARTSPAYCLENNLWRKIYIDQKIAPVTSMGFDEKNDLWYSTFDGLYRYNFDTTIFWGFFNSNIPSPEVTKILVKNSSEVYFFTTQTPPIIGSISSLSNFNGNRFTVLSTNNEFLGLTYYNEMTLNGDNDLAVLCKNKRIYENKNNLFHLYGVDNLSEELKFNQTYGLIFDNETGYWSLTDGGLFNYTIEQVINYNTFNSGLNSNQLSSILIRDDKNMFIGTFDRGINIFSNYIR